MATIRKRGNRWQVQVRRKNSASLVKSFVTRKDAEAWARQTETELDRNALVQDRRRLERVTLGELVARYRDTVTPHKRSAKGETIILNAFLRHPICSKKLSELTPNDFNRYRDERLPEVKPRSLKRMLCPIQNLFEVAKKDWGLPISRNPVSELKITCENDRRERRLQPGELETIKFAARRTRNPIILPIILFALETGLRRSELLAIQWRHIDWEGRSLSIPRAKNGHSRVIPLTHPALALLREKEREEGTQKNRIDEREGTQKRVFPTTPNALRLAWERLIKRAKIEDLRFHDLRHEAISRFFELDLTAPEVAFISGHRDPRMLFRYAHAQKQRILDRFDQLDAKNSSRE